MKRVFKRFPIILFLLLAFGCRSMPPYAQGQDKNLVASPHCAKRISIIGVRLTDNPQGQCEILSVLPNLPAAHEDIKPGDVILTVDGVEVKTRYEVVKRIERKSPDDHVLLTLQRKGELLHRQVQPRSINIFDDAAALSEIVFQDQPVRLAIVIGQIENRESKSLKPAALDQWKTAIKSEILAEAESLFRQANSGDKYFSVVDTRKTEMIIKEVGAPPAGFVSDEFRSKLKKLGATHLLIIDFSRSPASKPFKISDVTTRRLIEVDSGKTLDTARCTMVK